MADEADNINKIMSDRNIVSTVNLDYELDLKAIHSRLFWIFYDPESFDALIMRFRNPLTTAIISASGKVVCTGAKTKKDAELTAIRVARTLSYSMGYPVEFLHEFKIEGVSTGTTKLPKTSRFSTASEANSPLTECVPSDIHNICSCCTTFEQKLGTHMNRHNEKDYFMMLLSEKNPTPQMAGLAEYLRERMLASDPTRENIVSTVNLNCKLDLKAIASKLHWTLYDPESFDALIMRFMELRTTALVSPSGKVVCTGAKTEHDAKLTAAMVASTLSTTMGYPVEFSHELKIEGASTGIKS